MNAPIILDPEPVKLRADALSKIWWQGKQWAVTSAGIECRDGTYFIDAKRLGEKRHGTDLPDWPLHMAEKTWVNLADFSTAFLVALVLHNQTKAFNSETLRETYDFAVNGRDTFRQDFLS